MLRLIDPTQTHEFVPDSEKDKPPPHITFHVRAMTSRQWVKMAAQAKDATEGALDIQFEAVRELLLANIDQIDNGGQPITHNSADMVISEFIDACTTPEAIQVLFSVFKFIQELSTPDETELKN